MCALRREPPPPAPAEPRQYARYLGRLRLYLNDLDDLVRLLRDRTSSVVIEAGDAKADEPADLREATSVELQRVRFVTSEPDLLVTLGSKWAYANTVGGAATTGAAQLLVDDVHGLLVSRRTGAFLPVLRTAGRLMLSMSVPMFLLLLIFGALLDGRERTALLAVGVAAWMLMLLLPISDAIRTTRQNGCAIIVPEYRSERRGFSRETKGKILAAVAGAAMAGVVAIAVAMFT